MEFHRKRCLLGVISLMITGIWLTVTFALYYAFDEPFNEFIRSRLLWEAGLALQIISIAMMYECQIDAISEAQTFLRKVSEYYQLLLGLLITAAPLWIMLMAGYMNWLSETPLYDDVMVFGRIIAALILAFGLVRPLTAIFIRWKHKREALFQTEVSGPLIVDFIPIIVMLGINVLWQLTTAPVIPIMGPLLICMAWSAPYLVRATFPKEEF